MSVKGRFVAVLGALAVLVPLLGVAPVGGSVSEELVYVSSSSAGSVPSGPGGGGPTINFGNEDVLLFDSVNDEWSLVFDGSAAGVGGGNVDGFSIDANGDFLLSFTGPMSISPISGTVDDSDVVVWDGSSFTLLLDGSDVGLTSGGEDVDAIGTAGPTNFALSTSGSSNVPRTPSGTLAGRDEDLLDLTTTLTGSVTDGDFAMLFDGSDVGQGGEDISGAHVDPDTGVIYLSMLGNYTTGGVARDGDDVVAFTGATGENTSGTFASFFDGDAHNFGGEQIDALYVDFVSAPPQGEADLSVTKVDDVDPVVEGATVNYTVTVTNNGPDTAVNVVASDTLPAGVTFVSTTGCSEDPNGFPSCSLGNISDGASAQYTITVTIDQGTSGTITNSVSVTSGSVDNNPGDNTASEDTFVGQVPDAVDDGPATNSMPGDDFHTDVDTTLNSSIDENLLENDDRGDPLAVIDTFAMTPAGGTANLPEGDLTVNDDGSFTFDPAPTFEGLFSFNYQIVNSVGSDVATASIFVGDRPAAAGSDLIYISTASAGTVDGISYQAADILVYDTGTDTWAIFFDASDVSLSNANINALTIVESSDPIEILFSLTSPFAVPGITGTVDDSDVIRFVGTGGEGTTAGTMSLHLDGTDLFLRSGGEDVDALTETTGGKLAMSTLGSYNVQKTSGGTLTGSDEDLIEATILAFGPNTIGDFERYLDGSDVSLTEEDLTGASYDTDTGDIFFTSLNVINVPGLSGDSNDVIVFTPGPGHTGENSSGTFSTFFDADAARLTDTMGDSGSIDGLHVELIRTGTITIVLDAQPDGPQDFGFGSDVPGHLFFDLDDDNDPTLSNTLVMSDVMPGTYSVTDFPLTGWDVTSTCDDGSPATAIDLSAGEHVTCTFTIVQRGSFLAVKQTLPDGDPQLFEFSGSAGPAMLADGDVTGLGNVVPGTYTATEVVPPGWDLTDISCDDGGSPTPSTTAGTTATFEVDPGEAVVCTFTNTKRGTINIVKETDPVGGTGFGFTDDIAAPNSFTLDHGQTQTFFDVVPGTYTVTEDDPTPGFDLTGLNCVDSDAGGSNSSTNLGARAATINLDPGETVTCTYTNTERGAITIVKDAIPDAPQSFDFTGDLGDFSLVDNGGTNSMTFTDLVPMAYDVTESDPSPATLADISCDDGASATPSTDSGATATINLDPGENVTCTFTNSFNQPPEITSYGGLPTAMDSIPENATNIENIESTDPDGTLEGAGGLTYSISGGDDSALFSIQTTTGILVFSNGPDFENPLDFDGDNVYDVHVTVTDPGLLTDTVEIEVTVTDVNEAPVANPDQGFTDEDTVLNVGFGGVFGDMGTNPGQFNLPSGVAVDGSGNIVIADRTNHRIQTCHPSGTPCTTFGSFGTAPGQFNGPSGIALDSAGNIVVAGRSNHRIQICDPSGTPCTAFGSVGGSPGQFNQPFDVAVDSAGNIVIADTANHRIQICDPSGTPCTAFGSFGSALGEFNSPIGVAIDSSGNIVIADADNDRIQICDPSGTPCTAFGSFGPALGDFNIPAHVAIDSNGDIVIADASNDRIQICDPSGTPCTAFGSFGSAIGQFDTPVHVAISPNGDIVVADRNNHRIQIVGQGGVLANDTDPENDPRTVTLFDATSTLGATVNVNPDGSYTYDPTTSATLQAMDDGDSMDDTFTYTVSDGALTDVGTVTITVTGSDDVPAPDAVDDSYDVTGNVGVDVQGAGSILTNDLGGVATGLLFGPTAGTVTTIADGANTVTTSNNGVVELAPDGTFTYDPAPGFEGTDSFFYEASNAGGADTAEVVLTVADVIWFIDNEAGTTGDGTVNNPFDAFADLGALDEAGDCIFVADGAGNYLPVTLLDQQRLVGDGSTGTLDVACGITLPTHSNTLPTFSGTDPILNVVTLAKDNTVRGLDIFSALNTPLIGSDVDGLVITEVDTVSNTGGPAIDINGGVSASVTIDLVNSGSGSPGTFGVDLTSSAGSTFNFGTVTITNTGGTGFNAASAGTVNVTGSANTIDTTTGTALSMVNTTIGTSGMTFKSISASGGGNGINVQNTGSGAFTVNGVGSTDGSGGTIENTSGDGVRLISASNVTLKNMIIGDSTATVADGADATTNINGHGIDASGVSNLVVDNTLIARTEESGIHGVGVVGFTLTDSEILNAGDDQEEHGLDFDGGAGNGLTGTATITNVVIDAHAESGIEIVNVSGMLNITIEDTSFADNQTTPTGSGEEGILFAPQGTAIITALVKGDGTAASLCRFDTLDAQGIDGVPVGSSTLNLTIDGCVFTDTDAADGAIKINPDFAANANVTIKNNIFGPTAPAGPEIFLKNDSSGILDATIDTNMATTAHVGRNIEVFHDDGGSGAANGTTRLDIKNNTFGGGSTTFEGIYVDATENTLNADVDVSFIVTNNTVSAPTGGFGDFFGSNAIFADSRNNATICADITGNTATGGPFGAAAIAVQQAGASVMQLEGLTGGAAAFLGTQNPASTAPIGAAAGTITSATACPSPAATPTP